MVNQKIWIGIAIGIFFVGLGIGYGILQSTSHTDSMMMKDPQHMQKMMNDPQVMEQFHSMMMNDQQHMQKMMSDPKHIQKMVEMMRSNPQTMNSLMNSMMSDPQFMTQWHNSMMQNPQFMNRWMGQMMNDPNFQQQYMGPWMMMREPQFMQNMMNQYSQQYSSKDLAVKTNNVSILAETWQYQSTKSYSPELIEVSVGTAVTWTNNDVIIHTVTDLGGKFDSGFIQPDETWKYTFDSAGTYYYYCSIHPWMKGAVIAS
jgi:plastocyanin